MVSKRGCLLSIGSLEICQQLNLKIVGSLRLMYKIREFSVECWCILTKWTGKIVHNSQKWISIFRSAIKSRGIQ